MTEEKRIPGGVYKGRGIAGSEQYGATSNGNDQIALDLALADIGETATTFLIFTDKSAEFSIQRLRALGWQGDDLSDLTGIDRNEVDVEIKYEVWEGKERMRVQILTGGGRVVLQQTMDTKAKKAFAAKFKGVVQATTAAAKSGGSGAEFPYGANVPKQASGVKL